MRDLSGQSEEVKFIWLLLSSYVFSFDFCIFYHLENTLMVITTNKIVVPQCSAVGLRDQTWEQFGAGALKDRRKKLDDH